MDAFFSEVWKNAKWIVWRKYGINIFFVTSGLTRNLEARLQNNRTCVLLSVTAADGGFKSKE